MQSSKARRHGAPGPIPPPTSAPPTRRRLSLRLALRLALLLLPLSLAACGGGGAGGARGKASGEGPPPAAAPLEVPRPDLTGFEPVVRERVESLEAAAQAEIDRLAAGGGDREAAGEALGRLGRHYHSFLFLGAAETCYAEAARLAPGRFDWAYLLGEVQAHQGETREAVASFERARELAPNDPVTAIRLGDLYLQLDRTEEARAVFSRAVELDPASAAAHFGLGRTAALAGHPAEARDHFERALELQPDAAAIHYPLAQAYRALGDEEQFRRHLRLHGERGVDLDEPLMREIRRIEVRTAIDSIRSLAGRPDRLSDEELVNFAAAQLGGLDGALDELAHAVATEAADRRDGETAAGASSRARVLFVLGSLEARRGRDPEAVDHLRQALDLAPGLEAAKLPLAVSLARGGRSEEALDEIKGYLARHPEEPRALLARAAVWTELGRHADALADLRRAVAAAPEDGAARLRLAAALERSGEIPAAVAELQRAVGLELPEGDQAIAHHRLGELLRRQGRLQEAEASYQEALRLDPELVDARLGLAAALGQEGLFEEVLEIYGQVLSEHPDNETARVGEATALLLAGRNREARERLEAGLEALPASSSLARLLARHLAACPDPAVRDGARALELATRLLRAQPTFEDAETFAMALAQAGRFQDAAQAQEELMRRAATAGHRADLPRLAANLERYRRGESCCAGG